MYFPGAVSLESWKGKASSASDEALPSSRAVRAGEKADAVRVTSSVAATAVARPSAFAKKPAGTVMRYFLPLSTPATLTENWFAEIARLVASVAGYDCCRTASAQVSAHCSSETCKPEPATSATSWSK